jgi:hypothetical protein
MPKANLTLTIDQEVLRRARIRAVTEGRPVLRERWIDPRHERAVHTYDADEPDRRERARTMLAELPAGSAVLNAQVLGEFFWTTTWRLRTPLPVPTATIRDPFA